MRDGGGARARERRIRSFVAIGLPDATRRELAGGLQKVRRRDWGPALRWLRPESWHVTLRFLGEVEAARLETLGRALRSGLAELPAFELRIGGIDLFPNGRRPRVLVAHADGGPALLRLADAVERIVVACGLPSETRPFRAHLTLGRFRGRPASRLQMPALRVEVRFRVDAVALFRSTLGPRGAVYSELAHCPLAPGRAQSRAEPGGRGGGSARDSKPEPAAGGSEAAVAAPESEGRKT